jgi:hypothetical protein
MAQLSVLPLTANNSMEKIIILMIAHQAVVAALQMKKAAAHLHVVQTIAIVTITALAGGVLGSVLTSLTIPAIAGTYTANLKSTLAAYATAEVHIAMTQISELVTTTQDLSGVHPLKLDQLTLYAKIGT